MKKNGVRRKGFKTCCEEKTCSVIHPDAKIGKNVRLGHCVVIEKGCSVGDNTFLTNFVVMREGSAIGRDCIVGHYCVIEDNAKIGNRVHIMPQCHIVRGIIIEDDVFIGPGVISINDKKIDRNWTPPIIRACAKIGAASIIMPGVEIGAGAFVGSASVVTKDVPFRGTVIGHPARLKSTQGQETEVKFSQTDVLCFVFWYSMYKERILPSDEDRAAFEKVVNAWTVGKSISLKECGISGAPRHEPGEEGKCLEKNLP